MKISRLLVLLCVLLVLTNNGIVSISCVSNSSCSSGYGILYENLTHFDFECTAGECQRDIKITYQVGKCTRDIFGIYCSTGICLNQYVVLECANKIDKCSMELSTITECERCQQNQCYSDLCLLLQGFQICYENSECQFQWKWSTYKDCENNTNYFGEECTCCAITKKNKKQAAVEKCIDDTTYNREIIEKYESSNDCANDVDDDDIDDSDGKSASNEEKQNNNNNFELLGIKCWLYIVLILAMWSL